MVKSRTRYKDNGGRVGVGTAMGYCECPFHRNVFLSSTRTRPPRSCYISPSPRHRPQGSAIKAKGEQSHHDTVYYCAYRSPGLELTTQDTVVSWASLEFQPEFTATASNIGYGQWSHDIGGHMFGIKVGHFTIS